MTFSTFLIFCLILVYFAEEHNCISTSHAEKHFAKTDIRYKTLYFEQPVDHFGFSNQDKYRMRYLLNDDDWDSNGGPIFFYCGNEGDIELFSNNTGAMWEWAPEFKAMVVFAEHRYYGQSQPYGQDSYRDIEHLGYLSSEQALADFARLLTSLKANITGADKSPVIAFGGSYGGMLATWFRMKYPNVVAGSLAASAPIWMFGDLSPCNTFFKIVTADFQKSGPHCAENIKASWSVIDKLAQTDEGRQKLTTAFKMCSPLKSVDDVGALKGWLYNTYGNLAMIDYPYAASFLEPLPAWPVKEVCKHLNIVSPTDDDLITHLSAGVSVYYNYTGSSKCLNLTEGATSDLGDVGWDFQACSEMVMPMCTDGKTDMFEPDPWNYDAFAAGCKKRWNVETRPNWALVNYGGKNLDDVTNIIFSNGGLDPWSGGGVLKDLSPSLVSILIPEGAHHLDLRASNPNDPPSVTSAREREKSIIKQWIDEYQQTSAQDQIPIVFSKHWYPHTHGVYFFARHSYFSGFLVVTCFALTIAMLIVLVTRRRRSPRAAYVMPPPRYLKTPVVATNARAYEKAPLLPTVQ